MKVLLRQTFAISRRVLELMELLHDDERCLSQANHPSAA
jgi:hypothetical protein